MATVLIEVSPPGSGTWTDITSDCMFQECSFSSMMNGVPGQFDVLVRDPDRTRSFTIGSEIRLTVDGVVLFGGYILTIGMKSIAPAADTSDLSTYVLRAWHLQGPDYNIAFDRRFVRNTGDYLSQIKINSNLDSEVLGTLVTTYADMGDFSPSGISPIGTIPDVEYVTVQQGWPVRREFETLLPFFGAVYYIDGSKVITWKAYDDVVKRWGFSDAPNDAAITASPAEFQGAYYGFREVEATEDAMQMANDVFAWGGSQFAGASGGTVVARYQDAVGSVTSTSNTYIQHGTVTGGSSIDVHGRWQHAETHFGETLYKSLTGVKAVASAILTGPPGTDATGQQKGLKSPQWSFGFKWTSNNVPMLSGYPDHIRAGDLVTINLSVFGVTRLLPVRSLTITFPDAFEDPPLDRLVQFDGSFGLQLSDSFTLWRYVIQQQAKTAMKVNPILIADPTTGTTTYGAQFIGVPTPACDGAQTLFTLPFGYISGTLQVYLNGLIQRPGIDFLESSFLDGEFTMTSAPVATDNIEVTMSTLSA